MFISRYRYHLLGDHFERPRGRFQNPDFEHLYQGEIEDGIFSVLDFRGRF